MICFFLVIKDTLVRDFRDCLNFSILVFFSEKKMVKNGVYRDEVLGYSLRLQKVHQTYLFPTTILSHLELARIELPKLTPIILMEIAPIWNLKFHFFRSVSLS